MHTSHDGGQDSASGISAPLVGALPVSLQREAVADPHVAFGDDSSDHASGTTGPYTATFAAAGFPEVVTATAPLVGQASPELFLRYPDSPARRTTMGGVPAGLPTDTADLAPAEHETDQLRGTEQLQRIAGSSPAPMPLESIPTPQLSIPAPRLTSFADAGAAAVAAGIASRQADGSYLFHAELFHAGTESASDGARAESASLHPLQRSGDDGAAPEALPASAPSTPASAPPASSPTPGGQPNAESELDLDALARRLYPKIRPYLRRELWIDRERAAAATDRRS